MNKDEKAYIANYVYSVLKIYNQFTLVNIYKLRDPGKTRDFAHRLLISYGKKDEGYYIHAPFRIFE